ncbi:MAG: imidazole glycerol phosphate synthase subunit HisH [Candidatus Thermoplasmatota archaeon]|nr:imidazole glycerol phosphate synthase subunit HisH [Candidatus Thermoplasmatota archaeon]MBS3789974.1 imidazole glycerol phosphate synthase subunit HisH [Candidatus Thermoplasmatota archaeon]
MTTIVDLGLGNISNVKRPIEGKVTNDPYEIEKAEKIIIPGVGNFSEIKDDLSKLKGVISDFIEEDKPFLGICLGMQVLFGYNEEGGDKGLDILEGEVKRLKNNLSPHIGWNTVRFTSEDPLFKGIGDGSFFYFAHSYYVETKMPVEGETRLRSSCETFQIPAVIKSSNIYGTQFHPEKSGSDGLKLLKNFELLEV